MLDENKLYTLLKQFEARLNALEDSVNNTLIGGLKEAANKYVDEENYGAFGEKYGLKIYSKEGCYTKVEVRLPIRRRTADRAFLQENVKTT